MHGLSLRVVCTPSLILRQIVPTYKTAGYPQDCLRQLQGPSLCANPFSFKFFLSHHTVVWLGYLVYFGVTKLW